MTISTLTRRAGPYAGNGATTVFAFAFKVYAAADVLVVLTDSAGIDSFPVLTTNYTVALNPDQNAAPGGNVVLLVAPPAGVALTIGSKIAATQPNDLSNAGGLYPKVITEALDRLTALSQQNAEKLARAALSPFSDAVTTLVWPRAATRNGKIVIFDAAGQLATGVDAALLATFLAGAKPTALPGQNVVATYAAMTALLKATLSDGLTVLAVGGAARGDGLGGVFYWDAASVLAADGTNTFAANEGGSGRWRRAGFPSGSSFVSLTVSGTLNVGFVAVTSDLSAGGALVVGGNVTFAQTLTLTGNAALGGTLGVVGNTALGGTLGVTGTSTFTGTATFNGRLVAKAAHTPRVTVAVAANTTIDCLLSNVFSLTMTANITTLTVSNPQDGQTINARLKQDGTGGRTVVWPASFKWAGGVVPVLSTAANARDLLVLTYWADEGVFDAALAKALA